MPDENGMPTKAECEVYLDENPDYGVLWAAGWEQSGTGHGYCELCGGFGKVDIGEVEPGICPTCKGTGGYAREVWPHCPGFEWDYGLCEMTRNLSGDMPEIEDDDSRFRTVIFRHLGFRGLPQSTPDGWDLVASWQLGPETTIQCSDGDYVHYLGDGLDSAMIAVYKARPYKMSCTYQVVTPESAEDGEAAENGYEYEDQEFDSLDDLIREIIDGGATEPSQSPGCSPDTWYTHYDHDGDLRTGARTNHSYHPKGLTAAEAIIVFNAVTGKNLPLPSEPSE